MAGCVFGCGTDLGIAHKQPSRLDQLSERTDTSRRTPGLSDNKYTPKERQNQKGIRAAGINVCGWPRQGVVTTVGKHMNVPRDRLRCWRRSLSMLICDNKKRTNSVILVLSHNERKWL